MRYFIYLSYDGTRYHGWQIQPNALSVQEELQRCLSTVLRIDIPVTGAGRTDTGVHARMMVAHFDYKAQQPTRSESADNAATDNVINTSCNVSNNDATDKWCQQLTYKLNRILPPDIAIQRIEPVADDMHARFSATSRTYHYYIHTRKEPFCRSYSLEVHYPLDFNAMNEAGRHLLTVSDFASFCKVGADNKTTICDVRTARWVQTSETEWYFEITADRFLRNMVRAVVGTLIDVGRGKLTLSAFKQIIEAHRRTAACESMPAHALFLEDIRYEKE